MSPGGRACSLQERHLVLALCHLRPGSVVKRVGPFPARIQGYARLAFLGLQPAGVPRTEAPAVPGLATWHVSRVSPFPERAWV